jgi:hypothetical protein
MERQLFFWVDKWLDRKSTREIAPDLIALILKRDPKRRIVREEMVEHRIYMALRLLALWQYV